MKDMLSSDAADKLNLLIRKNWNASKQYKWAAEYTINPALRGFLNDYAIQREQFALDLYTELLNLNKPPIKNGDISGKIQRAWFNLKSTFRNGRDQAVLEECVNGERTALDQYRKILKDTRFYPATQRLLINQQLVVENAYRRIKELEGLFNEKRKD